MELNKCTRCGCFYVSYQTGITVKNLNRFLKLNDFKKLKNL